MTRSAGILLPVSSLPSPYGVGVFGKEARAFLDKAAAMKFHKWQVLPFTMVDAYNSPYASVSAFAGNYLFIDPRGLAEEGLLTKQEAEEAEYPCSPYTADYAFAKESRLNLLRLAFSRLNGKQAEKIREFAENQAWLPPFALFMAIQKEQDGKPWWEWPEELAKYELALEHRREYETETAFWKFVQFEFFRQWAEIKSYAEEKKIEVIGDMPIYVSRDSSDVWANRELFLLDPDTYEPEKVAGVPPDYFSEDGQLWGNPLYNWGKMAEDGFAWWMSRLKAAMDFYHIVRIDHFRALASFWAVPVTAKTAKEGGWMKGPGMAFFDAVKKAFPEPPKIIAEDLGVFGEDVVELLEKSGLPGMRVVQFGFEPGADSSHLPHNYPHKCVAYVGTHDNNTLLGWLWEATPEERAFALRYCGFSGGDWSQGGYKSPSCRAIIEAVWRSAADTAIISIQDMCGFGSDTRMNVPGSDANHWRFRIGENNLEELDADYFAEINALFSRG